MDLNPQPLPPGFMAEKAYAEAIVQPAIVGNHIGTSVAIKRMPITINPDGPAISARA
jgi:hypothetical protein